MILLKKFKVAMKWLKMFESGSNFIGLHIEKIKFDILIKI